VSKTVKALLVIMGGLLLLACIGCYGLVQTYRARQEAKRIEFESAARRLGFEPTLDGVTEYIKESIVIGMQRSEVEQTLDSMAPLEVERGELNEDSRAGWGPIACDELWLDLGSILIPGWVPIIACYDEMGGLVKLNFAGPDAPSLDIYAPLQE
jgi:hypothetical protein